MVNLLLILASVAWSAEQSRALAQNPTKGYKGWDHVIPTSKLHHSFEAGDGLYLVETEPQGNPIYLDVAQKLTNGWRYVRKLSDLKGRVQIKTAKDALAFVRLRTSPVTAQWLRESELILELAASEAIDLSFTFGDAIELDFLKQHGNGIRGIYTAKWMKTHKVPAATAVPTRRGWQITRVCFTKAKRNLDSPISTVLLTEFVGTDGTVVSKSKPYHRTFKLPTASDWIAWFLER